MKRYRVLVGNVGMVLETNSKRDAMGTYKDYVMRAQLDRGRCAGESVTLFDGEEIIAEHIGTMQD